jgi:hypothetical protein
LATLTKSVLGTKEDGDDLHIATQEEFDSNVMYIGMKMAILLHLLLLLNILLLWRQSVPLLFRKAPKCDIPL